jgi:hypothetical protein
MKEPECTGGPKALANFEHGMTALFKVPKAAIVALKKRGKVASSERKPNKAGQGPKKGFVTLSPLCR